MSNRVLTTFLILLVEYLLNLFLTTLTESFAVLLRVLLRHSITTSMELVFAEQLGRASIGNTVSELSRPFRLLLTRSSSLLARCVKICSKTAFQYVCLLIFHQKHPFLPFFFKPTAQLRTLRELF